MEVEDNVSGEFLEDEVMTVTEHIFARLTGFADGDAGESQSASQLQNAPA